MAEPDRSRAAPLAVQIDDPATMAEVTEVFRIYEAALLRNDAAVLDAMFLASDRTVRYGVAEVQYGIDEVRRFRAAQAPFDRHLSRTVITTFGQDVGVASTLFHRTDTPGQTGRQTQTWIRTAQGWQVAAAHVSMMDETPGNLTSSSPGARRGPPKA